MKASKQASKQISSILYIAVKCAPGHMNDVHSLCFCRALVSRGCAPTGAANNAPSGIRAPSQVPARVRRRRRIVATQVSRGNLCAQVACGREPLQRARAHATTFADSDDDDTYTRARAHHRSLCARLCVCFFIYLFCAVFVCSFSPIRTKYANYLVRYLVTRARALSLKVKKKNAHATARRRQRAVRMPQGAGLL